MCVFPSEHDVGEDDIYDCVPCEDDGDDIYEDIIKVEVRQPMVRALCWLVFMSVSACLFIRVLGCVCLCVCVTSLTYDAIYLSVCVLPCSSAVFSLPDAADQIHAGKCPDSPICHPALTCPHNTLPLR